MAYEIGSGVANRTVTLTRDGEEKVRTFAATKNADEAIREVGREFNLASVNVENEDGEELSQADCINKTLGEVGNLTIYKKDVGAV